MTKKRIGRVVLRGGTMALQNDIRRLLRIPQTLSLESEQITEVLEHDDSVSAYLFKPSQTGLSAVAEMTAAAIKDPENTIVLSLPDEDETDPVMLERTSTLDVLKQNGVPVFETPDDASAYLNGLENAETTETEGGTGNY